MLLLLLVLLDVVIVDDDDVNLKIIENGFYQAHVDGI